MSKEQQIVNAISKELGKIKGVRATCSLGIVSTSSNGNISKITVEIIISGVTVTVVILTNPNNTADVRFSGIEGLVEIDLFGKIIEAIKDALPQINDILNNTTQDS